MRFVAESVTGHSRITMRSYRQTDVRCWPEVGGYADYLPSDDLLKYCKPHYSKGVKV